MTARTSESRGATDRIPRSAGIAAVALLVGAGMMFAGGGLPFLTSLGGEAWTSRGADQLAVIAAAPTAWLWANGLILGGTVLTVAGLAAATQWLDGPHVPGRVVTVVFGIGAGLWMAVLVGRMSVITWIPDLAMVGSPHVALYEAFDAFQERVLDVFMVLGLGSMALLGRALLRPRPVLGTALLAVSAAGVALGILDRIPAFVYIATAVLGLGMLTTDPLRRVRVAGD